ncbi:DnaJ-domain-containing protein [Durotheca rogersii]|uniref:DnaJ-domain-containing protein n=1 Tax=Durotheca rogersii TaxID=419775 RepID=UPI0022209341|nr:DnaJ-domain-containing protein [Durotheca rogersii]KAI5868260.1 DnaJ-domain-containing protein [Durotheca rogersii]
MGPIDEPRFPDHYADLGLTQQASSRDIKLAFNKLARLYHPDKLAPGQSIDAKEFRKVREAYECLIDKERRAAYDRRYFDLQDEWVAYRQRQEEQRQREEAQRAKEAQRAARERAERERRAAEAERARRAEEERRAAQDRAERERLAEERSREAARRAREEQQRAARERLLRARVEEAARRSEEAARRVRAEQEEAARERLRLLILEEKQDEARRSWASMREAADQRAENRHRKQEQKSYVVGGGSGRCAHPYYGWSRGAGRAVCIFCGTTCWNWSFRCPKCGLAACWACKTKRSIL